MKSTFVASALAAAFAAAFALPSLAADADKPAKTEAAPAKMHSHVEEKTGVPQKRAAADPAKADPAKNRALHLHPRDGKQ